MKIGFFGTPGIASYCLEGLLEKYDVAFVVAPEDKCCGRNLKLSFCEAKDTAVCNDLEILQPQNLTDESFIEKLREINADIFVVVAYGKIIPRVVFDMPRLKTINLHPSLLPKYRGAAPVEWSLIHGEKETGITVQLINEELDAGDIVLQEKISVDENLTAGELYDIVLPKGLDLLDRSIQALDNGTAELIVQDHDISTYCGKIDREYAHIDWSASASTIHNRVRGLNPKPGCWTTFREKNMKVWKTSLFNEENIELKSGELLKYRKKHLLVGTGDGILEILELQPETKKLMNAPAFINGARLLEHESFE